MAPGSLRPLRRAALSPITATLRPAPRPGLAHSAPLFTLSSSAAPADPLPPHGHLPPHPRTRLRAGGLHHPPGFSPPQIPLWTALSSGPFSPGTRMPSSSERADLGFRALLWGSLGPADLCFTSSSLGDCLTGLLEEMLGRCCRAGSWLPGLAGTTELISAVPTFTLLCQRS